jgi:transcriptional regulator with XRE-family HTH domain
MNTVKQAREKYGLTQQEAAAVLGRSISAWRNWELGLTRIDPLILDTFHRRACGHKALTGDRKRELEKNLEYAVDLCALVGLKSVETHLHKALGALHNLGPDALALPLPPPAPVVWTYEKLLAAYAGEIRNGIADSAAQAIGLTCFEDLQACPDLIDLWRGEIAKGLK